MVFKVNNMKNLLNKKMEQELESMAKKNSRTYSTMEDFYNIILFGNYNDEHMQKMLDAPNLLDKLVDLWIDDDRALELQKTILQEFLAL